MWKASFKPAPSTNLYHLDVKKIAQVARYGDSKSVVKKYHETGQWISNNSHENEVKITVQKKFVFLVMASKDFG